MQPLPPKHSYQTPPRKPQLKCGPKQEQIPKECNNQPKNPVSPPKHYNPNGTVIDVNINAESSSHCPLDRRSPQKSQNAKSNDIELVNKAGRDLNEFIRNSNVVFKSSIGDINLDKIKANHSEKKQPLTEQPNKNYLRKPPTPPRKRIVKSSLRTSQLSFSDNFQSSNLRYAIRQNESTYYLVSRFDSNTRQNNGQWIYFHMKNQTEYDQHFRIIVLNMTKNKTLFGEGLKLSVCRCGVWGKQGKDIWYWKNDFIRWRQPVAQQGEDIRKTNKTAPGSQTYQPEHQNQARTYYSLSFTLFLHAHQDIYVSYNQPYTYSRLTKKLSQLTSELTSQFQFQIKRSVLGRTFLDNRVEVVSFSDKQQRKTRYLTSNKKKQRSSMEKGILNSQSRIHSQKRIPRIPPNNKIKKQKGIILILSRANPIDTGSSFITEGIMEEIVHNPLSSQFMNQFTIKVIPMINPDGVIIGNSKCNAKGYNLAGKWRTNSSEISPQITSIKALIEKHKSNLSMIIDIRCEAKQKNTYFDGLQGSNQPKQLVFLFSKLMENESIFSKSRWSSLKNYPHQKKNTFRVAVESRVKTHNILTMVSSQCSASNSNYHYDQTLYKEMGRKLLEALYLHFCDNQEIKIKKMSLLSQFPVTPSFQKDEILMSEGSQSEIQERIFDQQQTQIEDVMQIRVKSREGSHSNPRRKSYHHRALKGSSADKSNTKINSINHDETTNKDMRRKRSQHKKTEPNERELSSRKKSVKSFDHKKKVQSHATSIKHQDIKIRIPIRIPQVPNNFAGKQQKSASYELKQRSDSLRRAIVQSVNQANSKHQLKPILQASSEMRKSQIGNRLSEIQIKSVLHSQIKPQLENKNTSNHEDGSSSQQQKIGQFFQKVGMEVAQAQSGLYQIIKNSHQKPNHSTATQARSKINGPKMKMTKNE